MYLARGINAAKWKKCKIGRQKKVPATGITHDLRVEDNCLSFWTCDPSQASSLEEVVVAFAATRDNVDRLDLVWIDENVSTKANATIVHTPGDTPAVQLRDRHRNVAALGLAAVSRLAHGIANATNGTQTRRWTRSEVLKILTDAASNNQIDVNLLSENIASKIQPGQANHSS